MPRDPKKREGLSKFDQKFMQIIDEYDWHVLHVFARCDEGDSWSY
jgi:hypothetical protein